MSTCECQRFASHHDPGQCVNARAHHVRRDGVDIWVCVDCILSGDKRHVPLRDLV
jgi:hypothetical protein